MLAYKCEDGHFEAAVISAIGKAVFSVVGGLIATGIGGRGGQQTLAGVAVGGAMGAVVDEIAARIFPPPCGQCNKPTVAIEINLGDQPA